MRPENDERWNELCALAVEEAEPVKRVEIVKELNNLFREIAARQQAKRDSR